MSAKYVRGDRNATPRRYVGKLLRGMKIPLMKTRGNLTALANMTASAGTSEGTEENIKPKNE